MSFFCLYEKNRKKCTCKMFVQLPTVFYVLCLTNFFNYSIDAVLLSGDSLLVNLCCCCCCYCCYCYCCFRLFSYNSSNNELNMIES